MYKELDNLIEWGTEYAETPIAERDMTIYPNNNKDKPFSSDGIEERCLEYLKNKKERIKNLTLIASRREVIEIGLRIDSVKEKIGENAIKSRFDILDIREEE